LKTFVDIDSSFFICYLPKKNENSSSKNYCDEKLPIRKCLSFSNMAELKFILQNLDGYCLNHNAQHIELHFTVFVPKKYFTFGVDT